MIKDKKTAFAIYVVLFVVFWNIAEILWRTITGSGSDAAGVDIAIPLFTYCLSGARSRKAVRTLKSMGYTNVINMGGINNYKGEMER